MSLETMTKLASTTVGSGGTTAVTFSNIPQGYTDLVIKASYRSNRADGDYGNTGIRFNNDTLGASYFSKYMFNYNRTASGGLDSGTNSYIRLGGASQATQTALTFTNNEIYVHNYSGNNVKGIISEWGSENNGQMTFLGISTGYWNNSAPITSLSVFFDAGAGEFLIENSTFVLYGVKNVEKTAGNSIKATGGNIVFDGTYVTHTFNSSGVFTPTQPLLADCLLIAGGGGGGYGSNATRASGGGGAGGLLYTATQALTVQNYTITVGAGGTGGVNSGGVIPTQGVSSTMTSFTSPTGGGFGGSHGVNNAGNGGSGGGGGDNNNAGTGISGQGNNGAGGSGFGTGGGGGGAGAVGSAPIGGAGATYFGSTYARGGDGGNTTDGAGTSGATNTANGGNGGRGVTNGGAGGSGIVIIRYKG
jgi:hypothetical protein